LCTRWPSSGFDLLIGVVPLKYKTLFTLIECRILLAGNLFQTLH
jgi:hypothetical protein